MNNIRLESDKRLKKVIQSIHLKHKEYGYPRMKIALEEEGYFINHKKVYRLMSELNIQSIIRKKRRFFKGNCSNTFPNILNREFKDRQQNEALVTDITYLRFQEGFRYLSVVQDIYNNEVVSWKISKRNDNELVLDTIEMLAQKRDVRGTILHSDQGFQYTSHAYNKRLFDLGIIGSHSRKGNCHDNACIESFFSHFKSEMLYLSSIMDLYNNEIIAYEISNRQDVTLVLRTVEKAIKLQQKTQIILHSDQGAVYTSYAF